MRSGFRKKYSCEMALLSIVDDIFTGMDEKMTTILVLLGFSKAFETINYERLISKLKYFRIPVFLSFDTINTIFRCLRSNVNVFEILFVWKIVNFGGNYSSLYVILCGVPQGSILGPLLFIVYTADFHIM